MQKPNPDFRFQWPLLGHRVPQLALAIIMVTSCSFSVYGQGKIKSATTLNTQTEKRDLLFDDVRRMSNRYPDQVASDLATELDDGRTIEMLVPGESKIEAWQQAIKMASTKLGQEGLVILTPTDRKRVPVYHELGLHDALNGGQVAFRPKDQAAFKALMDDVEILGSREVAGGKLTYGLKGYFLVLNAENFDFGPKGCTVRLRIENLVMAHMIVENSPSSERIPEGYQMEKDGLTSSNLAKRICKVLANE